MILALIVYSTTREAWPAFQARGPRLRHQERLEPGREPVRRRSRSSTARCSSSVIALVIAVPVSIGIALFITEVAPRRLRRPIVYVIDLLAAIPSVVFGLWGMLVLAPASSPTFYTDVADAVQRHPGARHALRRRPRSAARSFMTAGLILAIMITPIITSITREVFATVPAVAEGGGARARRDPLGDDPRRGLPAQPQRHRRRVLLGLGRAMGETIAVALVIGSSPQITARALRLRRHHGRRHRQPVRRGDAAPTGRRSSASAWCCSCITIVIGMIARALVAALASRKIGHGPMTAIVAARSARSSAARARAATLRARATVNGASRPSLIVARRSSSRSSRWCSIIGYVVSRGSEVISWDFLTERHPVAAPRPSGRAWARRSSARCSSPARRR